MTQVAFVTIEGVGFTQEEAENAFIAELRARVNALKFMDENKKSLYGNVFLTFIFFPFIIWGSISLVAGIGSAAIFGFLLGVNYGWFGTLGHDVGHGQALRKHPKAQSHLKLFLGNVCLGFSHDWWEDKHNKHHFWSHVNERDPDTKLPLAMSAEQARDMGLTAKSFRVKHARWIFPLLLPLQAFAARISSYRYIKTAKMSLQMKRMQRFTMALHVLLYGTLLTVIALHAGIFPALVFALVNQGTHGVYNSSIFATNHKQLPVVSKDVETRWVWRQLYSSHNVASGSGLSERVITWIMGALNYQIEHHLFQTMPRYNLRKLRPHVKELCAKYGLPYNESSPLRSYWDVFRMWSRVSYDLLDSPMGA